MLRDLSLTEKVRIGRKVFSLMNPAYMSALEDINKENSNKSLLPNKIGLSEAENSVYDLSRLKHIDKLIDFLIKFYMNYESMLTEGAIKQLDQVELEFLDSLGTLGTRNLIREICKTISNLSGNIRWTFKQSFELDLTWEAFEELGGLTVVKDRNISLKAHTKYAAHAEMLLAELRDSEQIIDAAVPDIAKDFIIFKQLVGRMTNFKLDELVLDKGKIKLWAIKALTNRMSDINSLRKLLDLSDNSSDHPNLVDVHELVSNTGETVMLPISIDACVTETKLEKHAALRRIELIGEFITGKRLSSTFKKLSSKTDWEAWITLRNFIVHQDEGDSRLKINRLIDNKSLLEGIMQKDTAEIFLHINELIKSMSQDIIYIEGKEEEFWSKLLERTKSVTGVHAPANIQVGSSDRRVLPEEEEKFLGAFDAGVPMVIVERCRSIFDGSGSIPQKREQGDILKHLSKNNKELRNECRTIFNKACERVKVTLEEREEIRQAESEAAAKRQQDFIDQLEGLENIRSTIKLFQQSKKKISLYENIRAAIISLENIKEFLESDGWNFNFHSVEEWSKHLPDMELENIKRQIDANPAIKNSIQEIFSEDDDSIQIQGPSDVEKLVRSKPGKWFYYNLLAKLQLEPKFNDAIEYNAAQLLQQLERMLERIEPFQSLVEKVPFINSEYEKYLRPLRNHLEHGHRLIDAIDEEYDPSRVSRTPIVISSLQKTVVPVMINSIFKLLPELQALEQHYIHSNAGQEDLIGIMIVLLAEFSSASAAAPRSEAIQIPDGFKNVDDDGHCFYHAISEQLALATHSAQINIHELQLDAIEHILSHPNLYHDYLPDLQTIPGTQGLQPQDALGAISAYVDYHLQHLDGKNNVWADALMIQAMSNVLGMSITVHMFNADGTAQIYTTGQHAGQEVVLNIPPSTGIPATNTLVLGNIANVHFVHLPPSEEEHLNSEELAGSSANMSQNTTDLAAQEYSESSLDDDGHAAAVAVVSAGTVSYGNFCTL